jgi:hypothetical protein
VLIPVVRGADQPADLRHRISEDELGTIAAGRQYLSLPNGATLPALKQYLPLVTATSRL